MNFIKFFKDIKVWTLILAGMAAVGMTIDRPVWMSEFTAYQEETSDLQKTVGGNTRAILQIRIDTVQRRLWDYQDRYEVAPSSEIRRRIREIEEQKRLLEEEKAKVKDDG